MQSNPDSLNRYTNHSLSNHINESLSFDLFISDLHLCASRPAITQSFIQFLNQTAIKARSLYILGDLFEYWAGDDDTVEEHNVEVIKALNEASKTGVGIFVMHGNRDFLIGTDFCKSAGVTLLKDPTLLELYQQRILLSHGDDLCTDDADYMQFKALVRQPSWIAGFLSKPLQERKAFIASVRERSEQEKNVKSSSIMDVNTDAVAALVRAHHYPPLLIHGHTHRPNTHHLKVDGHTVTRLVLGDWYEQGSYLLLNETGFYNVALTK